MVYLSAAQKNSIGMNSFIVFVVALCTSIFARISVGFLLISFTVSPIARATVWVIIALQLGLLIASEVTQLLLCRPIRALWDAVPDAECMTPSQMWATAYTFIGVTMFSDAVFAILPMFVIWRLSRSVLERALLSALMGLSLVAMAVGVGKIYYLYTFNISSPDNLRGEIDEFLYTRIEELVIVIAANAPFLKSPIEWIILKPLGMSQFHNLTRPLNELDSRTIGAMPPTHGVVDGGDDGRAESRWIGTRGTEEMNPTQAAKNGESETRTSGTTAPNGEARSVTTTRTSTYLGRISSDPP